MKQALKRDDIRDSAQGINYLNQLPRWSKKKDEVKKGYPGLNPASVPKLLGEEKTEEYRMRFLGTAKMTTTTTTTTTTMTQR